MRKQSSNMHSQVRHADKLTKENYNCVRCGFVYKSITSVRTAHSSVVIQIMECNKCGYLWKETWEQPVWRFCKRQSNNSNN